MKPLPSPDRLREVLTYDPKTGLLFWRITRGNKALAGNEAGGKTGDYVYVTIDGVQMLGHRVIWAIVKGEWPDRHIDHEDRDGHNNIWTNLRKAGKSLNAANAKLRKSSTSGFKGVSRSKNGKRWLAKIINCHLGTFDTPEEAHAAYMSAAKEVFGEFARSA